MSLSTTLDPVFFDTIAFGLVQCFLTAAGGEQEAARRAARNLLMSYNVATEEELRLAAQIATFSLGALQILAKSMDPDLPLNAVLRLRGSANAQQRSANQCQRTLDKLRAERRVAMTHTQPAAQQRTVAPQPTQATAIEPTSTPAPARVETSLSRQQRRAMQRTAEKAQRKQVEQARRETMRLARTQASTSAGATVVPPKPEAGGRQVAA